ncbi:uncharacterized protein LOC125740677 isoform X1 [Brienomyrus brachyistius]|uniref:uncharacterized protein LOC125740677 isoform X1 n=1 Tax=Brienomyrus brachyistius TaxID=42636 RepID=UPI0020B3C6CF|nr:uncharacterized protein LOC125740677 isoform X1 [Brienomyrus brachyistius]XP_048868109.1 uncharacterized protein LOC125740677 isoform X1 [Brienomyrus brachyistius]XP_048868110.1 uncharacterized protein LOC125740677 isoform X1 [Brienomyrus brachyistius]
MLGGGAGSPLMVGGLASRGPLSSAAPRKVPDHSSSACLRETEVRKDITKTRRSAAVRGHFERPPPAASYSIGAALETRDGDFEHRSERWTKAGRRRWPDLEQGSLAVRMGAGWLSDLTAAGGGPRRMPWPISPPCIRRQCRDGHSSAGESGQEDVLQDRPLWGTFAVRTGAELLPKATCGRMEQALLLSAAVQPAHVGKIRSPPTIPTRLFKLLGGSSCPTVGHSRSPPKLSHQAVSVIPIRGSRGPAAV